ncbi:MAG TPA: glycoside hydrolase family 172 protein [Thermoguttaceae bacterium]|nr:glycoside hydrolase family 172 protein [Thermoguttaceae bacterium]
MKPRWLLFASFALASLMALEAYSADLSDIATVVNRTSHHASSVDLTGSNNDTLSNVEPSKTLLLLDTDGPGMITHMWFTTSGFAGHRAPLRDLVLRIYWEGSRVPSVEVPLGDFFGMGHGRVYPVRSLPINVGADPRAMNCYWPMPFYKHARIELKNVGEQSIRKVFHNIDYELGPIPPKQGLFHAEFRRIRELPSQSFENNMTGEENYVIMDTQGEGQYVGCFLFVDSAPGGWWGEGDEMIFIDGDKKPSINGTGTEDYFCEAWGFDQVTGFPFYGLPLLDGKLPDGWTQTSVYRFHIPDPVRFKKSIRVTIEHCWREKVANDYSSVAYWYQLQPIGRRASLPVGEDFQPRIHRPKTPSKHGSYALNATVLEPDLRRAGYAARSITTSYRDVRSGGVLRIEPADRPVTVEVFHFIPGDYRVDVQLFPQPDGGPVKIGLKGQKVLIVDHVDLKNNVFSLGVARVGKDGKLVVEFQSSSPFAVGAIKAVAVARMK